MVNICFYKKYNFNFQTLILHLFGFLQVPYVFKGIDKSFFSIQKENSKQPAKKRKLNHINRFVDLSSSDMFNCEKHGFIVDPWFNKKQKWLQKLNINSGAIVDYLLHSQNIKKTSRNEQDEYYQNLLSIITVCFSICGINFKSFSR